MFLQISDQMLSMLPNNVFSKTTYLPAKHITFAISCKHVRDSPMDVIQCQIYLERTFLEMDKEGCNFIYDLEMGC